MCVEHDGKHSGPVHPEHTVKGKCYFFYDKHHRPKNMSEAQWLPNLTQKQEFDIFDKADDLDICCPRNHLYGVRVVSQGQIGYLGTSMQQVAVFQFTKPPTPWHGFPMWPIGRSGKESGQEYPPPLAALEKMKTVGLISEAQRRRLAGGKHI